MRLSLPLSLALLAAPLAAQEPPPNPLARPPAWVGAWKGERISLELERDGPGAKGHVIVGAERYPLQAKPSPADAALLEGTFTAAGHPFSFTCKQEGPDALVLTSDGAAHRLARVAPATPPNPLGRAPAPPAPNPLGAPPPSPGGPGLGGPGLGGPGLGGPAGGAGPLADAWTGEATRRQNMGGAWSCELPQGYSVINEQGTGLFLNPGVTLQQGTVPDAVLACEIGELSPQEAQQPAPQLLRQVSPNLQGMLRQQGITVQDAAAPTDVQVDGQPGGVFVWSARGSTGAALTVWIGIVVKETRYVLVLGVVQQGKEAAFLPKMKRVFTSTRIAAASGPLSPPGQPGGPGPGPGPGMGDDGGGGDDEGN